MSTVNDLKAFYGLVMKPNPSAEEELLDKMREVQRRERKVKLYSYPSPVKSRNILP